MNLAELIAAPLAARIEALEQRIEALESRPAEGVSYAGVYVRGKTYAPGQLVTSRGLWLCVSPTTDQPGTPTRTWKLICKERGSDLLPGTARSGR